MPIQKPKGIKAHVHRLVERSMEAVDLDARDRYGRTALMWAADIGSCPAAEVLLELGADRRAGDPLSGRYHLCQRMPMQGSLCRVRSSDSSASRQ